MADLAHIASRHNSCELVPAQPAPNLNCVFVRHPSGVAPTFQEAPDCLMRELADLHSSLTGQVAVAVRQGLERHPRRIMARRRHPAAGHRCHRLRHRASGPRRRRSAGHARWWKACPSNPHSTCPPTLVGLFVPTSFLFRSDMTVRRDDTAQSLLAAPGCAWTAPRWPSCASDAALAPAVAAAEPVKPGHAWKPTTSTRNCCG